MPCFATAALAIVSAAMQAERDGINPKYTEVKKKECSCKNCGAPEIGTECQYCKTIFHVGGSRDG